MYKTKEQQAGRLIIMYMLFFFSTLLAPSVIRAQDTTALQQKKSPKKYVLGFLYENGHVFQTNPFVNGDNTEHVPIKNYQAFSGRIMFQTVGKQNWASAWHISPTEALKLPNFGLNTFSPRIEIRYKVHGNPVLKKQETAPFKKFSSLDFIFSVNNFLIRFPFLISE